MRVGSRPKLFGALILAAVPLAALLAPPRVAEAASDMGLFTSMPAMPSAHAFHTATVLGDGNVLVAGGEATNQRVNTFGDGAEQSVELYRLASNDWVAMAPLYPPRGFHGASLLPSGKVLIAGGFTPFSGYLSGLVAACGDGIWGRRDFGSTAAEIFNESLLGWERAPDMNYERSNFTLVKLFNGQVLAAGGSLTDIRAELYDPAANTWTLTGPMDRWRKGAATTLLPDGRVLVAGGDFDNNSIGFLVNCAQDAEVYDPASNTWSSAGALALDRTQATATVVRVADGTWRVLVAGGWDPNNQVGAEASAELWNPATNQFTPAASMATPRSFHTATLLPDGTVLVTGGVDQNGTVLTSAELYDPKTDSWRRLADMAAPRHGATASLLPSGLGYTKVLVAGGSDVMGGGGFFGAQTEVELFQPTPIDTTTQLLKPAGGATVTPCLPTRLAAHVGSNSLSGTPADPLRFTDNGTAIATVDPDSFGAASTNTTLGLGAHSLQAAYLGGGAFNPSSSPAVGVQSVLPSIQIAGPAQPVAPGNTVTLSATVPSGAVPPYTFTWTRPDGTTASGATLTATPAAGSSTYAVAGTDANGCALGVASFTVTVTTLVPLPPTLTAGYNASCGIRADASLGCWGRNHAGETSPPAGGFSSVGMYFGASCGVKTDASVVCWGTLAAPTSGSFQSVAVGGGYACGLQTDGALQCWGDNSDGKATPPPGGFLAVAAAEDHTCGIRSDFTLACWGLAVGGDTSPPAGSFAAISNGTDFSCAVGLDGTLACWGDSYYQQTTPPAGTFVSVSAGDHHACAVRSDGSVACWGKNRNGQASPPPGAFTSVAAGYDHTCGVQPGGTVSCWGDGLLGGTGISLINQRPPAGTYAAPYMYTFTSTFASGESYQLTGGALPPGLALSPAGVLSGTPTAPGTYPNITVVAANGIAPAASATFSITIARIPTALSVTSLVNPSLFGQRVTFSGVISPLPAGGNLAITDNGAPIPGCPAVTATAGALSCTTASLNVGAHNVTVAYTGDAYYAPGSGGVIQTVNRAATATTLTSSVNPGAPGQTVTYTAAVAVTAPGAGIPSGTLSFSDSGTAIAGCATVALAGTSARCSVTYGAVGAHSVIATYSGDASFLGSTSPVLTEIVPPGGCPSLSGCNLQGMNLCPANLAGADLSGANLQGARICGTLAGANLTGANLAKADLTGADLSGANLSNANLVKANFTNANLYRAVTAGATLTGAIWSGTTCPDGSNSNNDSGSCLGHL